ncbi:MAG: hypothetical protein ACREEE_04135 [Dongiaceae bacterium]
MAAALITLLAGRARAEPFIPSDESQVLEHLPTPGSAAKRELRQLRRSLRDNPTDLTLAVDLARRYIALGRTEFDPRYSGYAQAALRPWWNQPRPPVEVLVLRATLKQNRHDFTGALADLDAVLASDPRNAQAWLTRAVVLQVQGQYDVAQQSCGRLVLLAAPLVAATCLADTLSVNGKANKAYDLLDRVLRETPAQPDDVRLWSLTVLAETAARLGDTAAADRHFRAALDLGQRDAYLLGAYADFLLDQGRPAEAKDLLAGETRADPLLLRLALAEQSGAGADFAGHVQALSDRFAASRQRGDKAHLREEARFMLHLRNDPRQALRLALENWQTQRETWDARIVLEAALAANDPAAASEIVAWLHQTKLEDPAIASLLRTIRGEQG